MNPKDEVVLALTNDLDSTETGIGYFPPSTRRFALIGHFFFRIAAILIYFFCTWFTYSFVVPFVLVLISISFDFWFVKNISGRVLVGLRWSSYTDEEGQTRWHFDSRPSPSEPADGVSLTRRELAYRALQANDARLFWAALVATPVIWGVFLLAAVFSLHFRWALVSGISLGMSAVNLYGFLRCRLTGSNSSPSTLFSSLQTNITRHVFTDFLSTVTKRTGSKEKSQPSPSVNVATFEA